MRERERRECGAAAWNLQCRWDKVKKEKKKKKKKKKGNWNNSIIDKIGYRREKHSTNCIV